MGAFMTLVAANSNSEDRSMAIPASQQVLEALRLQDPELDMPNSGSDPPQIIAVGSQQFQANAQQPQGVDPNAQLLQLLLMLAQQGRNV